MTHANARQVGGNHYLAPVQHWDIAAMYELGYYEGQITKYIARHAKKHKAQDVEKALHFTEKLMELHAKGKQPQHLDYPHLPGRDTSGRNPVQAFCESVELPSDETMVINKMCLWHTMLDLSRVRSLINSILAKYTVADQRDPDMDGMNPGPGYVNQDPDIRIGMDAGDALGGGY